MKAMTNSLIYRTRLSGLALAAMLLASAGLASCSDDDKCGTPLDTPVGAPQDAAYNTLTFAWEPVEGARQYSCQLRETNSGTILSTEVTHNTTATYTDLKPSTDYTLAVTAYAAMESGNTTSATHEIAGRTADLAALATPQPVMSREVNSVIFTWEHVPGTESYAYSLTTGGGTTVKSGETGALYVTFADLDTDSYTFTLTAQTEAEGECSSQPSVTVFDFVRERTELWTASGQYTSSILGTSWDAELVAYDDNSYLLRGWYGVEGYDLEFSVDPTDAADMFKLSAESYTYDAATESYAVPTGLASPATIGVIPSGNQCALSGNSGRGSVQLYVTDGTASGADEFTWGLTIDDLCGEWQMRTTGMFYIYDDDDFDSTTTVTVTKVDDTTLRMPAPYVQAQGADEYIEGTVDLSAGTITFEPQVMASVYGMTFANVNDRTAGVTVGISKTRFTITDWTYWLDFDGVWYIYAEDAKVEMTR